MSAKRAVVLVSGGMDSAVTLAMARARGFDCHALSVAYGQRHASELDAAGEILERLDRAAPAPRPRRRPTDPPRPKPQAVVPEPDIDEDLVLDLSTLVDEEMGEVPPSDAGDGLPVGDEDQ